MKKGLNDSTNSLTNEGEEVVLEEETGVDSVSKLDYDKIQKSFKIVEEWFIKTEQLKAIEVESEVTNIKPTNMKEEDISRTSSEASDGSLLRSSSLSSIASDASSLKSSFGISTVA